MFEMSFVICLHHYIKTRQTLLPMEVKKNVNNFYLADFKYFKFK